MDVCVIGAGIIGVATAYHLSLLGAQVTVIDATLVPRGASAASFGWINANGKQPDHYFELNRAGMSEHAELARMLGDDSWLHLDGSLEWAGPVGADALAASVTQHAAREYPAELVSATRALQLEPELAAGLEGAGWQVAVYRSEGWADTGAVIDRMLASARAVGATVRRGQRVTSLEPASSGRVKVRLEDGASLTADVAVNCTGPDAGALASVAGLRLDTFGLPGLNAVTVSARVGLRHVVRAPGVHFRPETGGRVMVATPSSDKALVDGADPRVLARRNVEAASRCLLIAPDTPVEEVRVARRAVPPDGLPIVGRTADSPWLYHAVTHSGVTLAPLLGRLVAAEIVNESEDSRLAPYRPARFAGSVTS